MCKSCSRVGFGKVQRVGGYPKSDICSNFFVSAYKEPAKTTFCMICMICGVFLEGQFGSFLNKC